MHNNRKIHKMITNSNHKNVTKRAQEFHVLQKWFYLKSLKLFRLRRLTLKYMSLNSNKSNEIEIHKANRNEKLTISCCEIRSFYKSEGWMLELLQITGKLVYSLHAYIFLVYGLDSSQLSAKLHSNKNVEQDNPSNLNRSYETYSSVGCSHFIFSAQ